MTETTSQLAISTVCSEIWFRQVPEPARFLAAGSLGNIAFFGIDQALYKLVIVPLTKDAPIFYQRNKEAISFFFSYLIQIGFQHFLNALFVYGIESISTADKYFDTLFLTYSTYSIALVGSTIGNAVLMRQGVPKNVAFWSTIFGFGILNFFLLRYLISGAADAEVHDKMIAQERKSAVPSRKNPLKKFRGGAQDMWSGHSSRLLFERIIMNMLPTTPQNDLLQAVKRMGPSVSLVEHQE